MIMYHAVDGHAKLQFDLNTQQMVNAIKFVMNNPEAEICCSNEGGTNAIGDIAIVVEGSVSRMFSGDVDSYIKPNGKRGTSASWANACECDEDTFMSAEFPEAWVSHCTIKYIRIKEYVGRRRKIHYTDRYDMTLIEALNIPVVLV